MNKKLAYILVAAVALSVIAAWGFATHVAVYNPYKKSNVPIERVSMDEIKAWMSSPAFTRWTNMDALGEYLAEQGISLEEFKAESRDLSRREILDLAGSNQIVREYVSQASDEKAIADIECDPDDRELEFELTNIGNTNWYLTNQQLTTGTGAQGKKMMSDALVNSKQVNIWINGFLANSKTAKYWMGDKLFFSEGETFASACGADFLRRGKTVDCDLEPAPIRGGALQNTWKITGGGFSQSGTFQCD